MKIHRLLAVVLCASLGGCNPFTNSYEGERFARTSQARVVYLQSDVPPSARKIGMSRFDSTKQYNASSVRETAKSAGADLAVFDKQPLGMEGAIGPFGGSVMGVASTRYVYTGIFYRDASQSEQKP